MNGVIAFARRGEKDSMASDISVLVRPLWTRCIALELKQEGGDVEAALAESGLDWRSLNKADGWIPFVRHAELLEIAARELKNDCYGMTLAQLTLPPETYPV
jgi:hypothetical protein